MAQVEVIDYSRRGCSMNALCWQAYDYDYLEDRFNVIEWHASEMSSTQREAEDQERDRA